jgi:hypothetical protein
MFMLLSCARSEEECFQILRIGRWGERRIVMSNALDAILTESKGMGSIEITIGNISAIHACKR